MSLKSLALVSSLALIGCRKCPESNGGDGEFRGKDNGLCAVDANIPNENTSTTDPYALQDEEVRGDNISPSFAYVVHKALRENQGLITRKVVEAAFDEDFSETDKPVVTFTESSGERQFPRHKRRLTVSGEDEFSVDLGVLCDCTSNETNVYHKDGDNVYGGMLMEISSNWTRPLYQISNPGLMIDSCRVGYLKPDIEPIHISIRGFLNETYSGYQTSDFAVEWLGNANAGKESKLIPKLCGEIDQIVRKEQQLK